MYGSYCQVMHTQPPQNLREQASRVFEGMTRDGMKHPNFKRQISSYDEFNPIGFTVFNSFFSASFFLSRWNRLPLSRSHNNIYISFV